MRFVSNYYPQEKGIIQSRQTRAFYISSAAAAQHSLRCRSPQSSVNFPVKYTCFMKFLVTLHFLNMRLSSCLILNLFSSLLFPLDVCMYWVRIAGPFLVRSMLLSFIWNLRTCWSLDFDQCEGAIVVQTMFCILPVVACYIECKKELNHSEKMKNWGTPDSRITAITTLKGRRLTHGSGRGVLRERRYAVVGFNESMWALWPETRTL